MTAWLEDELDPFDVLEAHWSTGTIMAIFFAASLISAVLVGLGYSFGLGATAKRLIPVAIWRPVNAAERMVQSAPKAASFAEPQVRQSAERLNESGENIRRVAASQTDARPSSRHSLAVTHPTAIAATEIKRVAAENSSEYMVQIGAISNRREARKLVSQLRRRGFHAGIYPGMHDRYLHVQIGPFARAEQAQAVRHHVRASGFRAILKRAS